ncbi:MAG: tetratricopeptide repeat protein [Deltaproteobacteria bacterium]|jgi:Flp pilus assembly protein TadD|nr:tetratricopeptide repeat protein [Deltaproteobacteria bacterium]
MTNPLLETTPLSELKQLLEKEPGVIGRLPLTAKLAEIGYFAAHAGQVSKARTIFEGLLQAAPNLTSAKLGLAFTYLVANEFPKAEEGIREALAADPANSEARALLGLCLALSGREAEAAPILSEAMSGTGPAAELARVLMTGK